MRNPPVSQNYEYPSNVSYYNRFYASVPMYSFFHSSNYSTRPQVYQSLAYLCTHFTILFSQSQHPGLNYNLVSPISSSSATMDTQTYSKEENIDNFRDGI